MNPFAREQIQLMLYLGILKCKPNFEELTCPTQVETVDEIIDKAAVDYLWEVIRPFVRENLINKREFTKMVNSLLREQDVSINDMVKQINRNREEIVRILRNNGIDL